MRRLLCLEQRFLALAHGTRLSAFLRHGRSDNWGAQTSRDPRLREDHLATPGTVGLAGLGESPLAPGEGQGRGLERAHIRGTAYPKGYLIRRGILRAASTSRGARAAFQKVEARDRADTPVDAATPDREGTPLEGATHEAAKKSDADEPMEDASAAAAADAAKPTLSPAAVRYNEALIQHTATRQYESSVLPGRQLGLHLAPPPFTPLQQRQSRYDGQLEADDVTQRPLVQITESEPPAHMAREPRVAQAERRSRRVRRRASHRAWRDADARIPVVG